MNEIEKLASIFSNGFLALGRQIASLTQAINMQKPQVPPAIHLPENIEVKIPEIKLPPFPDLPKFPEIVVPEVNTRGIEKAIKDGLCNNKYPIFNIPKADPLPAPIINVPAPIVNVSPTPVEFPKEMEVKGFKELGVKLTDFLNEEQKNPLGEINSK